MPLSKLLCGRQLGACAQVAVDIYTTSAETGIVVQSNHNLKLCKVLSRVPAVNQLPTVLAIGYLHHYDRGKQRSEVGTKSGTSSRCVLASKSVQAFIACSNVSSRITAFGGGRENSFPRTNTSLAYARCL